MILLYFIIIQLFILFCIYLAKKIKLNKKIFISSNNNGHVILVTKNQEETIEGIIRSIAWNLINRCKDQCTITDIIIFDTGSTDDTLFILEKLSKEYEFLHLMSKKEYVKMILKLE